MFVPKGLVIQALRRHAFERPSTVSPARCSFTGASSHGGPLQPLRWSRCATARMIAMSATSLSRHFFCQGCMSLERRSRRLAVSILKLRGSFIAVDRARSRAWQRPDARTTNSVSGAAADPLDRGLGFGHVDVGPRSGIVSTRRPSLSPRQTAVPRRTDRDGGTMSDMAWSDLASPSRAKNTLTIGDRPLCPGPEHVADFRQELICTVTLRSRSAVPAARRPVPFR